MNEDGKIGKRNVNKQGLVMTIIKYDNYKNVLVEFNDSNKTRIKCTYQQFKTGTLKCPDKFLRMGESRINIHGEKMTIVEYNNSCDIVVEFDDVYKTRVKTQYGNFIRGVTSNPSNKLVFGVGITGNKYPVKVKNVITKEYNTWVNMLCRCFSEDWKEKHPTYETSQCCQEWLNYSIFYEWLHSQDNFEIWKDMPRSGLDKDIIKKHNKLYSPETCCLVPDRINSLFIKADAMRGKLPIGVSINDKGKYRATLQNQNDHLYLGDFTTPEKAFFEYKKHKEKLIQDVADEYYKKGAITEKCYQAMLNYEVEIDD